MDRTTHERLWRPQDFAKRRTDKGLGEPSMTAPKGRAFDMISRDLQSIRALTQLRGCQARRRRRMTSTARRKVMTTFVATRRRCQIK